MTEFNKAAPELSKYLEEKDAEVFVLTSGPGKKLMDGTSLDALSLEDLECFLLWLKWFGQRRKPAAQKLETPRKPGQLPWWHGNSPRQVAARFGLTEAYVSQLLAERSKLKAEVAKGEDAFKPDPEPKHGPLTDI